MSFSSLTGALVAIIGPYEAIFIIMLIAFLAFALHKIPRVFADLQSVSSDYRTFQRRFLIVYLLATCSDWVQGAYVYHLYSFYGYSRQAIGVLFIAGYLSSWILGTCSGPLADIYGRKKACIAYSIVYSLSCVTKHFANYAILMMGRILGGIATSLLFSAFESWLITEHRVRGYEDEMLSKTFLLMSSFNGIVAVLSGLAAQGVVMYIGHGNPVVAFDLAIVTLVLGACVVIATFDENYGNAQESIIAQMTTSIRVIRQNKCIWLTGAQQVLFESSMYIFVFLWTPTLQLYQSEPPLGLIFACFMLACSVGGLLFDFCQSRTSETMPYLFAIATLVLFIPAFARSGVMVMLCFMIFEGVTGLYFPSMCTLRSYYVPEGERATITNLYRFPVNAIVCGVLVLQSDRGRLQHMFLVCGVLQVGAVIAAMWLRDEEIESESATCNSESASNALLTSRANTMSPTLNELSADESTQLLDKNKLVLTNDFIISEDRLTPSYDSTVDVNYDSCNVNIQNIRTDNENDNISNNKMVSKDDESNIALANNKIANKLNGYKAEYPNHYNTFHHHHYHHHHNHHNYPNEEQQHEEEEEE